MPRSCPRPRQLNSSALHRFLSELPKEVARLVSEGKPREIADARRWSERLRYAAKGAKLEPNAAGRNLGAIPQGGQTSGERRRTHVPRRGYGSTAGSAS